MPIVEMGALFWPAQNNKNKQSNCRVKDKVVGIAQSVTQKDKEMRNKEKKIKGFDNQVQLLQIPERKCRKRD